MPNATARPHARNADLTVVAARARATARRRLVLQNAPSPARANPASTVIQ
jgi:hypothetical protein